VGASHAALPLVRLAAVRAAGWRLSAGRRSRRGPARLHLPCGLLREEPPLSASGRGADQVVGVPPPILVLDVDLGGGPTDQRDVEIVGPVPAHRSHRWSGPRRSLDPGPWWARTAPPSRPYPRPGPPPPMMGRRRHQPRSGTGSRPLPNTRTCQRRCPPTWDLRSGPRRSRPSPSCRRPGSPRCQDRRGRRHHSSPYRGPYWPGEARAGHRAPPRAGSTWEKM
jgi:hypothetical protein